MLTIIMRVNIKLHNRLQKLAYKIFGKKDDLHIVTRIAKTKPTDIYNLELIYLLLNNESIVAKVFWDAFTSAFVTNTQLNPVFTVEQLASLLEVLNRNNKQLKTTESLDLLNAMINFLSTNGLLRHATKKHIETKEIPEIEFSQGAIASLIIPGEYKKILLEKYKVLLLRSVLLIHGICPIKDSAHLLHMDAINIPSKKQLALFKKHGLIEDPSNKAKLQYNTTLGYFEGQIEWEKNLEEGSAGYNEWFLIHVWEQADEISAQLVEFIDLIKGFDQPSSNIMYYKPDVQTYLAYSARNQGLEVPQDALDKIIQSIDYLFLAIESRKKLHSVEKKGRREFPKTKEKIIDELGHEAWESTIGKYISISDLSIIAGYSNTKSILNDAMKSDSPLKRKNFEAGIFFTVESALEWLKAPARNHRSYMFDDFIPATQLEKEITVEDLKDYMDQDE